MCLLVLSPSLRRIMGTMGQKRDDQKLRIKDSTGKMVPPTMSIFWRLSIDPTLKIFCTPPVLI